MSDTIEARVRTIVAAALGAPPEHVLPETTLSIGDLGWEGFLEIALEVRLAFGISIPLDFSTWTTVADIVLSAERALAAPGRAAA
jgi:acyl carrier protein